MQKKELIYLCEIFDTNRMPGQLFLPLMERFSSIGYNVSVLVGNSGNVSFTNSNSINIIQCGLNINGKKNYFLRTVSYSSYLFGALVFLIVKGKSKRIIGTSNPPFANFILYLAYAIRGITYEFVMLDVFPDGLIRINAIIGNSLICKIWRRINRATYSRAKVVYCLGRDMVDLMNVEYGLDREKLIYVPHWSSAKNFFSYEFKDSRFVIENKLTDKFIVQYSGNMGLWHDMVTFVKSAYVLREVKEIVFLFIGDGVSKKNAINLANSLNLSNIIWKDFVQFEKLNDSLSACHVALISLKSNLAGVAVPCKFYGILASGRAVIAQVPNQSEIALAINEDELGVQVDPGDFKRLAEVIYNLYQDRNLLDYYCSNALKVYNSKYTLESAFKKFIDDEYIS